MKMKTVTRGHLSRCRRAKGGEGFWVQEGDKEEQLAHLDPLWLEM